MGIVLFGTWGLKKKAFHKLFSNREDLDNFVKDNENKLVVTKTVEVECTKGRDPLEYPDDDY